MRVYKPKKYFYNKILIMLEYVLENVTDSTLQTIAEKVVAHERITEEEGLYLFENADISYVGALANHINNRLHQNKVYFNRNFHIEPTNVCIFTCDFCSYSRRYKHRDDGWELSLEQMMDIVYKY